MPFNPDIRRKIIDSQGGVPLHESWECDCRSGDCFMVNQQAGREHSQDERDGLYGTRSVHLSVHLEQMTAHARIDNYEGVMYHWHSALAIMLRMNETETGRNLPKILGIMTSLAHIINFGE